jgi:hypothetical protein
VRSTVLPGLAVLDVERVVHAARRVIGGHVQRLEVVPVGLHLGAFCHLEAETDEHVLQPLPGLGDHVGVAAARLAQDLGEVDALGFQLHRALGTTELGESRLQARRSPQRGLVECRPASFFSSIVASLPRPAFRSVRLPFLPSTSSSMARTSSLLPAVASRASAPSRAAWI